MKKDLHDELKDLWTSAKTTKAWEWEAERVAHKIQKQEAKYRRVLQLVLDNLDADSRKDLAPNPDAFLALWPLVGVLHYRESGMNFHTHLHNGDPLSRPTRHVPANRPIGWKNLNPQLRTWDLSAADALSYDRFAHRLGFDPDMPVILDFLERFNGLGYRRRGINSPYLWSGTQHYSKGYYVADGRFSPTAVNRQLGCVPILKALGFDKRSRDEWF